MTDKTDAKTDLLAVEQLVERLRALATLTFGGLSYSEIANPAADLIEILAATNAQQAATIAAMGEALEEAVTWLNSFEGKKARAALVLGQTEGNG